MSIEFETQPIESMGAVEIVRQMKKKIADATAQLRTQSDLLRQRGVALPSGALDTLKTLKTRVDNLERVINDGSNELRSLRALAQNAANINSAQSTDDVLNQVIDTVITLTKAERGYIMLIDAQTKDLEFRVARGATIEEARGDGVSSKIISLGIVNQVISTGQPVLTDNASQDEAFKDGKSVAGFALKSILAVPLKIHEEVIGVVYCDNRFTVGLFKASDLALLNAFANQAAVAIQNARLFDSTRERLTEVSQIRERMDNIFTSIDSGIITLNLDEIVIVCNPAAEAIVGRDDMIGQGLHDVIPQLSEGFYATLEYCKQHGTSRVVECQPTTAQGERQWHFNVSPLRDSDNTIYGMALVLDDLTDQRASEAQLKEVQRYLPKGLAKKDLDTSVQEREITAFFCDVRGFTRYSSGLPPQELMTIINKYLALASDAINFTDGIVDKYMGDAVTGLFNTQLNPQQDHAIRAVQAAMQLVVDLKAQHEVLAEKDRLFFGIGIHTGEVVLGIIGGELRKEFGAMGEAVDVAKYLQEQAGEAEIVISEATYQLVKDNFECTLRNDIVREKKGYEEVRFYRVEGRKKGTRGPISSEFADLLADLEDFNLDDLK
jgi:PAS domain S-box-containing protein